MKINQLLLGTLVAFLSITTSTRGSTNGFVVPTFRTSANSEAGYWERFTVAYGAPGNQADQANATTGAVLIQDGSASSFITGSGNIYDFENALQSFTLLDSTPFTLGTVVLQTRSLGSELDYGAVVLNYNDGTGSHSLAPVERLELDRGTTLGASVSSLFQWDLTGLNVKDYSLTFRGAGPSVSFDAMTLDTWKEFAVVPEPSTFVLAGLGIAFLAIQRRVRRS